MTLLVLETRCLHGSPLQTEGQPENIRPTILHPENCRPLFFLYTKTLSSGFYHVVDTQTSLLAANLKLQLTCKSGCEIA